MEHLIAQIEDHLAQNPKDVRGWEILAPVYLRLGRFGDAAKAWRSAMAADGETAARQASLGEALVGAGNGVVTAEAKKAFERAVALDAEERDRTVLPRPRRRSGWPPGRGRGDLARHD